MTSKALTIASALRSLGNMVHGMRPHLLQQAILACILRKAYFGAETWWPGRTHPRSRPQADTLPISNLVNKHLMDLSTVILIGARAVLPVFHTTQVPVLHRESGSKLENGQAGGSYIGFQAGSQFLRSLIPLQPNKEVFDAEAEAALARLKAAITHSTA
ncbi:hypothetical protein TSTA_111340 [Talaromyces stipitatus ATCC 10500]|uniref:Uncharacterized protein n=1 Tax=Talaromyces stipitatus (strain ATCC 10500 / CBS 375.48 / QM 6759 / NRRL 1006) TaxID=441959 RepID=B8M8Z5_TALSN|nr:uncharacterized protein TSTA_111340 [Talaromyces stipitatus ATCC 10500]EED17290.1 hypothetical protein TSTA_111340 [Talaromyces stipitatus ATCC 10500]